MSAGPGTLAPGSRDPGPESPGPRGPGPGPGIGCRGPARDGLGPRARRRAGRWGREARGPGPDAGGPGAEAEPFPPEPVWAASLSVLISRAWFPGLPRRTAIPGPRRDISDRFRFFPAGIHLFAQILTLVYRARAWRSARARRRYQRLKPYYYYTLHRYVYVVVLYY